MPETAPGFRPGPRRLRLRRRQPPHSHRLQTPRSNGHGAGLGPMDGAGRCRADCRGRSRHAGTIALDPVDRQAVQPIGRTGAAHCPGKPYGLRAGFAPPRPPHTAANGPCRRGSPPQRQGRIPSRTGRCRRNFRETGSRGRRRADDRLDRIGLCAGVLKWAGASGVDVLTAARVVRAEGGRTDSG